MKIWQRLVDHVGVVGVLCLTLITIASGLIFIKSGWKVSDRVVLGPLLWIAAYTFVRIERDKSKRRRDAVMALERARIEGQLTDDQAQEIRRGLQ